MTLTDWGSVVLPIVLLAVVVTLITTHIVTSRGYEREAQEREEFIKAIYTVVPGLRNALLGDYATSSYPNRARIIRIAQAKRDHQRYSADTTAWESIERAVKS